MVQLKGTRLYFVIVGVIELALSLTFVICTKIVLEKYSDVKSVEAYSLFFLYYVIPGVLCILSGVTSASKTYVKLTIGFHIISIVISTIGAAISSVYWQMYKQPDACTDNGLGDCICFKKSYAISCADSDISRTLLAVLTAASIFMIMTSFAGSVLGCTNVCCDPVQSTDARLSRIDTSNSEHTVVSTVHHAGSLHETPAICLNAGVSIEMKNVNHAMPSDQTRPDSKDHPNNIENCV